MQYYKRINSVFFLSLFLVFYLFYSLVIRYTTFIYLEIYIIASYYIYLCYERRHKNNHKYILASLLCIFCLWQNFDASFVLEEAGSPFIHVPLSLLLLSLVIILWLNNKELHFAFVLVPVSLSLIMLYPSSANNHVYALLFLIDGFLSLSKNIQSYNLYSFFIHLRIWVDFVIAILIILFSQFDLNPRQEIFLFFSTAFIITIFITFFYFVFIQKQ